MKLSFLARLLLPLGLLAAVAHADPEAVIRAKIKAVLPDVEVTSVKPVPVSGFAGGLYQVNSRNYEPVLATGDGHYLIQGDLLDIQNGSVTSVSDLAMAGERKAALAAVRPEDMVIFPAVGKTKSIIYVFTDVDCGYCRKFHTQVPELNQRGVEVRYLAFPRGGPRSPVSAKLASVWCAKDRRAALTQAKQGAALETAPVACKAPVTEQYELGTSLGVRGTPAVFTQEGMQVGGYVPANELAKVLQLR